MADLLLASYTLFRRDFVRFLRVRNRVVGALLQPLIFFVILGAGLQASFKPAGYDGDYVDYIFPGIMLMILLFTSIFSTFSVIEDRREGFLQCVLASPAPRSAIVLGKLMSGAFLGALQAALMLLLLFTPYIDLTLSAPALLLLILLFLGTGFMLTNLGLVLAWPMKSTQGFHAIMTILLFPMWIFSGAAFPKAGVPVWLEWVMQINPLSHALILMRSCFANKLHWFSGPEALSLIYCLCFAAFLFVLSLYQVRQSRP